MRQIISKGQIFLLLICAAILGYGFLQIQAVRPRLQYMWAAPAVQTDAGSAAGKGNAPNQALMTALERMQNAAEDWTGILQTYSLDGLVEKASLTGENSVQARLTLLGPNGQSTRELIPRFGRLIYPEELSEGENVILIDESLALKLFRIAEAVDHKVQIGEKSYRVVGVLRHRRQVGDTLDYCAFIPLKSVTETSMQLDALCVTAEPIQGTGASVAMQGTMNNLFPNGTFIDLQKERMGAWLWLRVLLFLLGMTCMIRLARFLIETTVLFTRQLKLRLQEKYAWQLLPWILGRSFCLAMGFGICAFAFVLLMNLILEPVYIFPEWIPAVLVEWSDIQDAFWKVWKAFAVMREFRTPELMRLRFFTILTNGFSSLAGVLLFLAYGRFRTSGETVRYSLMALRRLGCSETMIRTRRIVEMENLGFVQMTGEWPANGKHGSRQVQMLRILDPERVLQAVPTSKKTGSFVLEVTDPLIADNNVRLEILCKGEHNLLREARRDWDIQMSVAALARILYGTQTLQEYLDSQPGCEMHMRNEAMDGFFAGHLRPGTESR